MDNEIPGGASHSLRRDPSDQLFALRDALVELSMALRDMQFEVARFQREDASVEVGRVLERISAASAGSKPQGRDAPF